MSAEAFTNSLMRQFPYTPTNDQRNAITLISYFLTDSWREKNHLFILKGYAGTGKTTIIAALVNMLLQIGKKSVLMAPTGRAAKVLSGYSKQPAHTIHRKIYFAHSGKDGNIILKLQKNLHKNTLFIVDEASMIQQSTMTDQSLFSGRNVLDDLFEYVFSGENCRMMFIGDSAQLPPIGLDTSPALDFDFLKRAYNLYVDSCELTEVVRQSRQSGILVNATRVREKLSKQQCSLPLFSVKPFRDIIRLNGADLEEELNSAYSATGREQNVVVCRSNKRANLFNRAIRNKILFLEDEISTGDHLMVVKNNYFWLPEESAPGFIANGDIIELMRIRRIEEMYGFRFADVTIRFLDYPDEKELDVKILLDTLMSESSALPSEGNNRLFQEVMKDYEEISSRRGRIEKVKANPWFNALQVKFAYALTCHKTQGGQWNTVFVDQGYLNDKMIDTVYFRWLYTALTRATRKLYLVNFENKFFEDEV